MVVEISRYLTLILRLSLRHPDFARMCPLDSMLEESASQHNTPMPVESEGVRRIQENFSKSTCTVNITPAMLVALKSSDRLRIFNDFKYANYL